MTNISKVEKEFKQSVIESTSFLNLKQRVAKFWRRLVLSEEIGCLLRNRYPDCTVRKDGIEVFMPGLGIFCFPWESFINYNDIHRTSKTS